MRNLVNIAVGSIAAAAVAFATAASAETLNLRVSTGFPSVHGIVTDIAEPWLANLEAESGVDIETTFHTAGSSFGALDRQLDQVRRGLVDAALGLAVVPRGAMPRTALGDIPFMAPDRKTATLALNSLSGTELAPDFEGLKLVAIMVDCSSLHTVSKPVETLGDLEGLRIRVPSPLGAAMVAAVGGVPVSMPQSEIYENLERNVIDGAITPWDVIKTLNLGEVMKHHTENSLFCGQLWFAFNERKFNAYPDAVKQAFDAMSGEAVVETLEGIYAGWDKLGRDFAIEQGGTMYKLSDKDMAAWEAASQPAVEGFLKETEDAGVTDIRAIKAALDAAVAKYSAAE